jgi:hypothetical protein
MKKIVLRQVLIFLVVLPGMLFLLSWLFGVPYIVGLLGLLAWATVGHLITLDDEMPGEWSNPEGSRRIWRLSVVGLVVKVAIIGVLFLLVGQYPQLKEWGA